MIFKFCQVVSHDDSGKATMHQQALMFECGLCLLVSVSTLYSKDSLTFYTLFNNFFLFKQAPMNQVRETLGYIRFLLQKKRNSKFKSNEKSVNMSIGSFER
ncbi:hypothetical protein T4B_4193 [Trichinella pseudospiralis]|uniref:Uncharacterized protein n=1 Tax=Trichinella pseudospiralis TaxID=6337 RepID=A0A0V1IJ69_TRIPS|nr:hypothetical protein T4B_4193 [Trichinella pseudospiralis]